MDNFTKRRLKELSTYYLKGHEDALIKINEMNENYAELLPIIDEITTQIIEEKRAKVENEYQDKIDNSKKYSKKEYDTLLKKLNKIKDTWTNLNQNKKELIDLLEGI